MTTSKNAKVGDRIVFKSARPDDITATTHTGRIHEIEGNCVLVGVRGFREPWSILTDEIQEVLK